MPLRFPCPNCGQRLSTAPSKAGQRVKCPTCKRVVHVPEPTATPEPATPSQNAAPAAVPAALADLPAAAPPAAEELVYEPRGSQPTRAPAAPDSRVTVPRRVVYLQGFLLGAVALAFFVFGVIVGTRSAPLETDARDGPFAITGAVWYHDEQGGRHPDVGSVACVVPATREPDQQLDAGRLGPAPDRARPGAAIMADLKALGGDWDRTDAEGQYRLRVPGPGRYFLLVISGNATRPPGEAPEARDLAEIGRYFLPATALLGQRCYDWQALLVREDRRLNHAF